MNIKKEAHFIAKIDFSSFTFHCINQKLLFLLATASVLNVVGGHPKLSSNFLLKCCVVLKPHLEAISLIGKSVNSRNFLATISL